MMQISRHWRLNAQRYRLEGIQMPNGAVSLQNRPSVTEDVDNLIKQGRSVKENHPEVEELIELQRLAS